MNGEHGDDPSEHKHGAPQTPLIKQNSIGAKDEDVDDDGTEKTPINMEYCTLEARLDSFQDWPCDLRPLPSAMAEAGHFYTGVGDKTKCYYCNGGLKEWKEDDDPWEQHALWFGKCQFVRSMKGMDYINATRLKLGADTANVLPE